MNKDQFIEMLERMTPSDHQKSQMKARIFARHAETKRNHERTSRRRNWLAAPAACLVLAALMLLNIPFDPPQTAYAIHLIEEDGATLRLSDRKNQQEGGSVSFVDSRPSLRFFIDGENIARIEITSETEVLSAKDWTETQHEKYWNVEYYQSFDPERQQSVADFDRKYDKKITMMFDKEFHRYDEIWYNWEARNLYKWAAADHYAHFYGVGNDPGPMDEQQQLKAAAGHDGSAVGHIQLDGYPEELREDRITITITDHDGHQETKMILVKVSNNDLGQTVVTATLQK